MTHPAITLIGFYQRFISPHKGYRCAYATLHNSDSCSHAVKMIIAEDGLWAGWLRIRERFADCRAASDYSRQRRKRNTCADCGSDCGTKVACELGSNACDVPACGSPCDLSCF